MTIIKRPTQDYRALARDRHIRAIIIFTFGYLTIAVVLAMLLRNWEFVLYIGVVLLLTIFTIAIRLYTYLSTGVLRAISILGLLHMMGGLMPIPHSWPIEGQEYILYNWWIIPHIYKFDNLVHGFGFATVTIMCWQALRGTLSDIKPRFGILALCMLAAMGAGSANEVIEYIATKVLPDTNVGGYDNNSWDLIWNTIGSFVAAIMIYWTHPLLDTFRPFRKRKNVTANAN